MPKGQPVKPELRRVARELLQGELLVDLKETRRLIAETEARTKVLFAKIHNMQIELQEHNKNLAKVFGIICELFQEPEKLTDLEKVVKDFVVSKYRDECK